jgi:integrase/recombinase XerC
LNAVDLFIQYLQSEKRYSQLTIRSYSNDLFQFKSFLEAEFEINDMLLAKHTQIRSWLASLNENKANAARSINRKISCLKSFYKYHLKVGNINSLPTQKLVSPKNAKRLPAFANESQMAQLMDEVSFGVDFKDYTNRLIISLLYGTGMRRSELLNLKESDIDAFTQTIKVLGKGNKERILPLIPDLIQEIKHYKQLKQEQGFTNEVLLVRDNGAMLYEKYIYLVVKKYLSLVSTQDKKSPHTLRHSFATHLLNRGAELNAVKELLGHASLAATQVYTHNTIDKLKNVFNKAHPKA